MSTIAWHFLWFETGFIAGLFVRLCIDWTIGRRRGKCLQCEINAMDLPPIPPTPNSQKGLTDEH